MSKPTISLLYKPREERYGLQGSSEAAGGFPMAPVATQAEPELAGAGLQCLICPGVSRWAIPTHRRPLIRNLCLAKGDCWAVLEDVGRLVGGAAPICKG